MLVSYNWLKDFLNLDEDPKELGEKITRTGVEIASVDHPAEGLKKLDRKSTRLNSSHRT